MRCQNSNVVALSRIVQSLVVMYVFAMATTLAYASSWDEHLGRPEFDQFWINSQSKHWDQALTCLDTLNSQLRDSLACEISYLRGMALYLSNHEKDTRKKVYPIWEAGLQQALRKGHTACEVLLRATLVLHQGNLSRQKDALMSLEAVCRADVDHSGPIAHYLNFLGLALEAEAGKVNDTELRWQAQSCYDAVLCLTSDPDSKSLLRAAALANTASDEEQAVYTYDFADDRRLQKAWTICQNREPASPAEIDILEQYAMQLQFSNSEITADSLREHAEKLRKNIETTGFGCIRGDDMNSPFNGGSHEFIPARCISQGTAVGHYLVTTPTLDPGPSIMSYLTPKKKSGFGAFVGKALEVANDLGVGQAKTLKDLLTTSEMASGLLEYQKNVAKNKTGEETFVRGIYHSFAYPTTNNRSIFEELGLDSIAAESLKIAMESSRQQYEREAAQNLAQDSTFQKRLQAITDSMNTYFGYVTGAMGALGFPMMLDEDGRLAALVNSGRFAEALVGIDENRSKYYMWTKAVRAHSASENGKRLREKMKDTYAAMTRQFQKRMALMESRMNLCDLSGSERACIEEQLRLCRQRELEISDGGKSDKSFGPWSDLFAELKSVEKPRPQFISSDQLQTLLPQRAMLVSVACVSSGRLDEGKTLVVIAYKNDSDKLIFDGTTLEYDSQEWKENAESLRGAAAGHGDLAQIRRLGLSTFQQLFPTESLRKAVRQINRMIVVADNDMAEMPFQLLVTDPQENAFLGLKIPISCCQSVEMIASLASRGLAEETRLQTICAISDVNTLADPRAILGDQPGTASCIDRTEADYRLYDLVGAEQEARSIAHKYGIEPILNAQATESRIRNEIPTSELFHVATHGYFPVGIYGALPMASGLWVAADPKKGNDSESNNDGLLQAWEINQQVTTSARLISLSACETGRSAYGHTLGDLPLSFVMSGSSTVIAAQWQVSDSATMVLMDDFYARALSGIPKDEALLVSAKALSQLPGFEHPYYWAGFRLLGRYE